MIMTKLDVLVIGSGPGGYIAAIRAAQLGFKVGCVEKDTTLGGTCLNVGCIPSKALLESSLHYYRAIHESEQHGIEYKSVKLDLERMLARKNKVVGQLTSGVEGLFKKNKIARIKGTARFVSANEIHVENNQVVTPIQAAHFIIATGSVPSSLPGIAIDENIVVSSTGALDFSKVPKRLIVVGGGYIGLEMGSVWSRLGSQVEFVESQTGIISNMDHSLSSGLQKILEKQGMVFHLSTQVMEIKVKGPTATLSAKTKDQSDPLELVADKILMSVGRRPFTEGLGLETIGVKLNKKSFIDVGPDYQTSAPGVYAIGDVIGGAMLAHKAEEEGVACAEMIAGQKPQVSYDLVPSILYTHPEVASVGKTEAQLKDKGIPYKAGIFRLSANGRALAAADSEGFVKLLAHAESDEILGAHIIAANASEMIHEICLAMEYSATAEDIALTMHGHPTLSEAIKEAALSIHSRTLNS